MQIFVKVGAGRLIDCKINNKTFMSGILSFSMCFSVLFMGILPSGTLNNN